MLKSALGYRCQSVPLFESGTFDLQTGSWNPEKSNWACWLINASTDAIKLKFNLFNVDNSADRLWVYNGPKESSPLLLKSSSNKKEPYSLMSTTNQVLVTFASARPKANIGFNATYAVGYIQYHTFKSNYIL